MTRRPGSAPWPRPARQPRPRVTPAIVLEYRLARHAAQLACDELCMGYATDHVENIARGAHPPLAPTFREFLIHAGRERKQAEWGDDTRDDATA